MSYYFTADEHYQHAKIIIYCNRPFKDKKEMNEKISDNHNSIVKPNDIVVHGGDFYMSKDRKEVELFTKRLNGHHIFIRGSHDKWMDRSFHEIWTKTIQGYHIVVCHYAMLVWPRSHYNSILLFGHSHGKLNDKIQGKCHDIGVDNNNFYPLSEDQIIEMMKNKPDNFNFVGN